MGIEQVRQISLTAKHAGLQTAVAFSSRCLATAHIPAGMQKQAPASHRLDENHWRSKLL